MRKYFFVRRYLSLVHKETKFKVVRDMLYEEIGASYEQALEKLIQRINIVEGKGETQQLEFLLPTLTNEGLLFSGFYADQELRLQSTLVISRIHIQEDVLDYIFYPEKGGYKGEHDCYFYLNGIIYTAENLSPEWSFNLEETVIKEVKNEEPYVFRGKLLCFYQSSKVMDDELPHCIVKLFRTDDGEFIIYSYFYNANMQAAWPRTILRSSSPHKIFRRVNYQLKSTYHSSKVHLKNITQFLQDLSIILKISY